MRFQAVRKMGSSNEPCEPVEATSHADAAHQHCERFKLTITHEEMNAGPYRRLWFAQDRTGLRTEFWTNEVA
jgi:hypothetical protein